MSPEEILSNFHRFQPLTDTEVVKAMEGAQQRLGAATQVQAKMVAAMFHTAAGVMREGAGESGWRHLPWEDFRRVLGQAAAMLLAPNVNADSAILAAALMACHARGIESPGEVPAPPAEQQPDTGETDQ